MKKVNSLNLKGLLSAILWIASLGVFAQNITINGTVTDTNNETVIGATITVKGNTSLGTVTDIDGNYTLRNVPGNATLQFSYVGMATLSVPVEGRTTINVKMETDTEVLDEIVITALGIPRERKSLGYAVSSIKGDELIMAGVPTNPLASIYGKAPGVGLTASSSGPTGGINIKVRGASQ